MNDKRILSLIAFGLFIAALLLPWPIAATGRDEPAMIFAGVSILLALTFATMSRRESFSRIVLVAVGGVFGLILVVGIVSVLIWLWRANASETYASREHASAVKSLEEARAMQLTQQEAAKLEERRAQQNPFQRDEPKLQDPFKLSNAEQKEQATEGKHEPVLNATVNVLVSVNC